MLHGTSADLTYILPQAQSAISFALPLDRDKIRNYLSKQNQADHEMDNINVNIMSSRLSKALALELQTRGYAAKRVHANLIYRKEVAGWEMTMPPDLSHRYTAVRSGVGSYGWSGNVGMKEFGAAILLGTVVTEAKLDPTNPLMPEESFCDKCKLCVAACPSSMFGKDEETSVSIGGYIFKHSSRKSYLPCQFVCGGFTGLHKSGKWSTWSPGRFTIPDSDDELLSAMVKATQKYQKWPARKDGLPGYENPALAGMNLRLTCANCQLICWGNREDTRHNYRLLTTSGCVIQYPDGHIAALPLAQARKAFEEMPPVHRELYE